MAFFHKLKLCACVCVFIHLTFLIKANVYSTAPWTPCETTKTTAVVGCPIANLSSHTEVSGKIFKSNSRQSIYITTNQVKRRTVNNSDKLGKHQIQRVCQDWEYHNNRRI